MIVQQKWISRRDLQKNPEATYVFGDNEAEVGFGGQALEMRGEPNAFGIPTKRSPYAFYSDFEDFERVKLIYDAKFAELKTRKRIVWPADGIGTGLADLKNRAPKIWKYLEQKTAELFAAHEIASEALLV